MDLSQNIHSLAETSGTTANHICQKVKVQIPADEGGEATEHMDEDASAPALALTLAPPQGGRNDLIVISYTEYEFLRGAHQRMDRLEQCFANMETQSTTQIEILKAIME